MCLTFSRYGHRGLGPGSVKSSLDWIGYLPVTVLAVFGSLTGRLGAAIPTRRSVTVNEDKSGFGWRGKRLGIADRYPRGSQSAGIKGRASQEYIPNIYRMTVMINHHRQISGIELNSSIPFFSF